MLIARTIYLLFQIGCLQAAFSDDYQHCNRAAKAKINAIVGHEDDYVIYTNQGVLIKANGPLRNGVPNITSIQQDSFASKILWVYSNGTHFKSRMDAYVYSQKIGLQNGWTEEYPIPSGSAYENTESVTVMENKLLMQRTVGTVHDQLLVDSNEKTSIKEANLPIILKNDRKYGLSRLWLGCEPDFCVDPTVDAVSNDGDDFEFYRGRYVLKISGNSVYSDEMGYIVDAATRTNGILTLYVGHTIIQNGVVLSAREQMA
ncbi:hypothetical protein HDE_13050 [Halotydeus destructor]|nr:hypothetical protein HDE_13050 [Halotydeus destructor]